MCKSHHINWACGHESELHQKYCAPKCEKFTETTRRLRDPCLQCATPKPSEELEFSRWGELLETSFRASHGTGLESSLGSNDSSQPEVDRVNRRNRTQPSQIPARMLNTFQSLPQRPRQNSCHGTARAGTPFPDDDFSKDVLRRHTNSHSLVAEQQHPVSRPSSRQHLGNGTVRPGTPFPDDDITMDFLRSYTNFDSQVPEQQHQPQQSLDDSNEPFRLEAPRPDASPAPSRRSWSPRARSPIRSIARRLRPSAQSTRDERVTEFREPGSGSGLRTRLGLPRRDNTQPRDAEAADGGPSLNWSWRYYWRTMGEQVRKDTESAKNDKNGYATFHFSRSSSSLMILY